MRDQAGAPGDMVWGDAADNSDREVISKIVDIVEEGVYRLDSEGRIVAVNDVFVDITGYTREKLLNKHVSLVVAEEDRNRIRSEINRLLSDNDPDDEPIKITAPMSGGENSPCELELRRVKEDGTFTGIIGTLREITQQERSRQQLKEERDMFAEGPTIVFRWDADAEAGWPVEYVSENVEDAFGYTPEDLESGDVSYADLLLDEELDRIAREVEENSDADTERFSHDPYRVKTKNGDIRWVKDTTKIVRDEDGTITNYLGYLVDITERKEREQELQRYETIVETINDGIYVKDEDGRFTMVNDAYAELTGYNHEELIGEHASLVVDEDTIQQSREVLASTTDEDSGTPAVEANIQTADGETVPTEGTFATIETVDGEREEVGVVRDITERRERERELELFRKLIDQAGDALFISDPESSRILDVNDTAAQRLGYSREELRDMRILDIETEIGSLEEWQSFVEQVRTEGQTTFDGYHCRKDGSTFPVEISVTHADLDREYLLSEARDVTDRKQRERRLSRYKEYTDDVLDAIDDVFYILDEHGALRRWNESLCTVTGYTDDEIADMHVTDFFGEDTQETIAEEIADGFETGAAQIEAEFLTREGKRIPYEFVASTLENPEGDRVLAGIGRDITERKQREQALEERKNELRALIDVLPVAVFVAEADGEIVEWNEAGEEIWGGEVAESDSVEEYAEYEAWWADSGDPVAPDEWPLARAVEGEEVTDPDEIRIKGFDGEYRTVLNHGMPVRDADGEVSRAVVTLVDITERKEYQRRLEESNKRLEQFAYAASHDLQEPLRMVSSYLRLIKDRADDELTDETREYLEFAVDGADRMRAMIEALLEYSRVETEGKPLEPTDLNAVFDDVLADHQLQIEESDAEITLDELPRVQGDPDQLRQVFQNLLENAIEYSGDAPPRIHVTADRDGSNWVISVRDEGIGISPDDQDHIFEVFERLHSPAEHDGVGIGLALCQRIVERHGGEIWVDSEPGKGATFSFTLPASDT